MKSTKTSASKASIIRSLRHATREQGLVAYAVAKRAGVSAVAVQRATNAERLGLAAADRLAEGLQRTPRPDAW
jgi:hypothetical protein